MEFQPHFEAPRNRFLDKPKINPSPQHVLVIRGRKAADLGLWFGVAYGTTNQTCQSQTMAGRIFGAPEVAQFIVDWVRVPNEDRDFSVRFFLDRYEPGNCLWQPFATYIAKFVPSEEPGPGAYSGFTGIRADGQREVTIDWTCQRKADRGPGAKEFKYLLCLPRHRTPLNSDNVSTDGGVINFDVDLAP
ncbi:hypothetical protein ACFPTO_24040 [Paraburkholderia denitrificans]|uniref:Uncharacterized protein n=1 Tax=Paraburkholderia denitrificans TaxID=694025 RepID=A0ABW0JFT6_9BURK